MSKTYKFIDNKPLGKDLFEGKSQERTAKVISKIIQDEKFQVIGIEGEWGTGKSNLVGIVDGMLNYYEFFIYDVWGHQEDEQRRSLLIELTEFLQRPEKPLVKSKEKWELEVKKLLSKKKEVTTENLPYLSIGFIVAIFSLIYSPALVILRDEINILGIENLLWKFLIVFAPWILLLVIYFRYLYKVWDKKIERRKNFIVALQHTFQVYTNKQIEETKIETISEEEPSVRDFRNWMADIDKDLNNTKLVIVLDNFDRLPTEHILSVWSSIHVFFSDEKYNNIKVIIPFDRKHIKNAFSDLNGNSKNSKIEGKTDYADDYINKTFDIVFRVAPPIMSSWKDFFRKNWETAFSKFDDNEFERVEQAYEILNSTITPREIVAFINNFISIKLIDDKIPDRYIAIYLLRQSHILEKPLEAITEFKYLGGLEPIYKNDEDYQKYITALAYQINSDNALEVIYKNRLRDSLVNNKPEEFKEIQGLPSFKYILKPVISELEDYRNPILVLDNLREGDRITESLRSLIWNNIHTKLKANNLNPGSVELYQLILLKNLTSTKQKLWLKNILNSLWLDSEDFVIADYIDNIDEIVKFCSENKLEIQPLDNLVAKSVSPENFKEVVDYKKGDYEKYKLTCENDKIDDYLISFESPDLEETSFIQYLNNPVEFVKFNDKLLGFIDDNKRDDLILFEILEKLKLTSNKKLDVKSEIKDADIHHLLSTTTNKDKIYTDLAALRLSLLSSSSPSYNPVYQKVLNSDDDEFHKNVAEQLEWYINYSDFLVGSVTFSNNLTQGVAKRLIQLSPKHRFYIIEPILENIESICNKNGIESEELLSTLNVEDENKLDKDRLLKLEPAVLQILKDSSSDIASKTIKVFNDCYGQRSKEEWEESFNDLSDKLFLQLKTIDFVNWNPLALEVFNSLLLKIADDSIIDNNDIISWLIKSFESSERDLDNTLINMRDRLIRNNNVTVEVFTLFITPLLKHASLQDKANDVVRTIFKTELLDSDECVKLMLDNSEVLKSILSKSGKSENDFRDGLKARIGNEEIQQLSKALGFKIKIETDESNEEQP
ncbi:P-loop NTPase fold protein [Flagellimonas sp.]|uniref:P-loop NTPase fold protein n=1 Tax=Flagellimonas sp. TaxID=2058762 RepID=UPI003BAAB4B0